MLVSVLAAVAVGMPEHRMAAVIHTGETDVTVDTVAFKHLSELWDTFPTPGFGGEPQREDTFFFPDSTAWPDYMAYVMCTDRGTPQPAIALDTVVADTWYLLVEGYTDAPAIRFTILQTGVDESPAPAQPSWTVRSPARGQARLSVALSSPSPVRVELFDGTGTMVRLLVDSALPAGRQEFVWDGRDAWGRKLGAGVYLARLTTSSSRSLAKLVLLD